ncbi:MAG: transposase [Bacteroidales bacterium]|nr:transposase [Bacteroidales bacterium]
MGNNYIQIHIQTVFAVKNREALIAKEWRDELYKYLNTIIKDQGHKPLAIGGTDNHIHIFFGLNPAQSLSSLVLRLKRESSEWINRKGFTKKRFEWQKGYGGFSYTKKLVPIVIRYILNQEKHHQRKSFREEYLDILRKNEIEYNEKYIFDDVK